MSEKHKETNPIVRWLESGHWTSEALKIALSMSLLIGGIYFVRFELPGLYERWTIERAESARIAEISKERDRLYERNKAMVLEAKKELVNEHARFCEETSTSREMMLDCLNKVKIQGE